MKETKVFNLSERERSLAEFYCGECLGNAETAAVKAGYSKRYARGNAHKIIKRKRVQEYIEHLTQETVNERIATITEIKEFWTEIMNDKNAKDRDRLRASELLAKAHGIFDW